MPQKKGHPKPEYSHEERADIVERVCALYESQRATIASCCQSVGITDRTFNYWVAQSSDFAERYKKAKAAFQVHYWEGIITPLAESALERLLRGEKKTEKKEEGKMVDGKFVVSKTVTTETEHLPNATVTIFAMKGLHPERFTDKHEHTGKDGGAIQFANIPLETRIAALKLLEGENGE